MRALEAFFHPCRVAVVGASERGTSSGGAVLQMLRGGGFDGEIVPVNPRGGTMLGLPVRKSLRELPQPADLAVVAVRPGAVLEVVRDAAASGHRHLLILVGGFAEAGAAGIEREAALKRISAAAGITVAGPNCAGIIHLASRFAATFLRDRPPGGGIAFVSQSGALAEEVVAAANDRGLPVGTVVSVGNAMHLGIDDYLAYLGAADDCRAVLIYMESVADPERFAAIARRVAGRKPVVALIGGRTAAGAAAVRHHTGAAAMSDAEAAAFCARCGVIRVTSLRRLLLAAKGFGTFPGGIGRRVALLSNSGGPGVLATDRLHLEGVVMPALPGALARRLRDTLPAEATVANPLDLLADARADRFEAAFAALAADAGSVFDALLMLHVVPFMVDADPVVQALAARARTCAVPVMHAMMGTLPHKARWFAGLEAAGVLTFNDVEAMAETAGLLAQYPVIRLQLEQSG